MMVLLYLYSRRGDGNIMVSTERFEIVVSMSLLRRRRLFAFAVS